MIDETNLPDSSLEQMPQPVIQEPLTMAAPVSTVPLAAMSPEPIVVPTDPLPAEEAPSKTTRNSRLPLNFNKRAALITVPILAVMFLLAFGTSFIFNQDDSNKVNTPSASNYSAKDVEVDGLSNQLQVGSDAQLAINGQLRVNEGFVLAPQTTPANPQTGQIYLNRDNKLLYYYNGTQFVSLVTSDSLNALSSSLGGLAAANAGQGLRLTGTTLTNSGVLSLQGADNQINVSSSTGAVTLSLPQDIATSSDVHFGSVDVTGTYKINGVVVCSASGCTAASGSNNYIQNGTSPQAANFNITGTGTIGSNLNVGGVISGDGSGLTSLNGSNITSGTVADARLSGNVTLQGNTFNGVSQLVQTTTGGLLPALDGSNLTNLNASAITSGTLSDARLSANVALLDGTGPQTFTGNNKFSGTILAQSSGNSTTAFQIQNSAGTSNLFVADTVNNNVGIGTSGPGYRLDVQGGDINTSGIFRVNGAQISSANLSNDANLAKLNGSNVFSTANTFSSTVSIQGSNSLTLGSGVNLGAIILRDGSSVNTATIALAGALGANASFQLPVSSGTQTLCTVQLGNCAGAGSGITGTGTANKLAKFNAAQSIVDSSITDDGTTVTVSASQVIQGSSGLTLGVSNTTNGQLVFKNNGNANALTLQSGTTGSNLTLTLPTADGGANDCLKTDGSGALAFAACTGGPGGGVTSVNSLSGVLTIQGTANQINVANGGSTITLSTPQDINTSSTVAFRTLSLTGTNTADNLIVANALSGATGKLLDLKVNSVSQLTVDASGNVNTLGQYRVNGVQISSANLSNDANIAKLNGTGPQTFTGNNKFTGTVLTQLDSAAAFQIQNAAGTSNLFNANTTTSRIGIGTAIPGYTLDVNGDINTSGVYRINGVTVCSGTTCTAAAGSNNYVQNGTGIQANTNFAIQSAAAGSIGGVIKGAGSQTADLFQLQNSSGAILTAFNATGQLVFGPSGSQDTNLYRSATDTLKTDDSLTVAGSNFTNNGSTLNTASALSNFASGGVIGTAAATVDIRTAFTINQTTASQTLSLPNPTDTTAGRVAYVMNIGTQNFIMHGSTIVPGTNNTFIWNGSAWTPGNGGGTGVPAGTIMATGRSTPSSGFIFADGSAVSRTTYADLFTAIGTTYGAGDGSTTFNLPDLRGRSPIGAGTGTFTLTSTGSDITPGNDTFTIPANDSIRTGTPVVFSSTGTVGTSVGNLANGTTYCAVRKTPSDSTKIRLATVANCTAALDDVITYYDLTSVAGTVTFTVNLSNRTLGSYGGEETHYLTTAELASHDHAAAPPVYANAAAAGSGIAIPNFFFGSITGENGDNTAHNVMDPYLAVNYMIAATNSAGTTIAATLQATYDSGNFITTTNARDVTITLADTATDANFIVNVASGSTGKFAIQANGVDTMSISATGAALFKNSTNSTVALQIQDSSASKLLVADTTNMRVYVGDPTPDANARLLVLDSKNTADNPTPPTCVNGGMYYNSSSGSAGQAKVCINNAWAALGVPVVTSLPPTPGDGDEVYYKATTATGSNHDVLWHLRYNISTTYWDFLGGPPLYKNVDTSENTASTTYTALATAGPTITLPGVTGDWTVYIQSSVIASTATNMYMSFSTDLAGTNAADIDSGNDSLASLFSVTTLQSTVEKTNLAANTPLASKYRVNAGSGGFFFNRRMTVTPIRIK